MRWILLGTLVAVVGCGSTPSPTERAERATILVREGEDLALSEKTAEAIEKYAEALELQPRWTQVRFDLGRLQFLKGQTHFMNKLEHERRANDAREAGDLETVKMEKKLTTEEGEIADPLLDEAAANLKRAIVSGTTPQNQLNGYIWLGTIHADYLKWQAAKDFYAKAKAMRPGGQAEADIDKAIAEVDKEIDKRAGEEVGPPPE